jgi:hypothetical protein
MGQSDNAAQDAAQKAKRSHNHHHHNNNICTSDGGKGWQARGAAHLIALSLQLLQNQHDASHAQANHLVTV